MKVRIPMLRLVVAAHPKKLSKAQIQMLYPYADPNVIAALCTNPRLHPQSCIEWKGTIGQLASVHRSSPAMILTSHMDRCRLDMAAPAVEKWGSFHATGVRLMALDCLTVPDSDDADGEVFGGPRTYEEDWMRDIAYLLHDLYRMTLVHGRPPAGPGVQWALVNTHSGHAWAFHRHAKFPGVDPNRGDFAREGISRLRPYATYMLYHIEGGGWEIEME